MKTESATGNINNVYRLSICVYDSFLFGVGFDFISS